MKYDPCQWSKSIKAPLYICINSLIRLTESPFDMTNITQEVSSVRLLLKNKIDWVVDVYLWHFSEGHLA